MINLNNAQTQLVAGGSYFTQEEYQETLNNYGLLYSGVFSLFGGGISLAAEANPFLALSIVAIAGALGYNFGYSLGMQMNSDPNSNELHGIFIITKYT
ncbi:MAG: hypothetical protein JSR17_06980 [Proteobacteria bacterium]|nr:hypothetical protein [Pseudomonadota bacterium]